MSNTYGAHTYPHAYLQILGIDFPQERVELLLVLVIPVGDDDDDGQDNADATGHTHHDLAVSVVLEAELALQSREVLECFPTVLNHDTQARFNNITQ